uniref:PLOD1-3-like GT domain-containing protein n=1 Tax=viral metagenome TaxID=1070528 RepID=A0A6C0BEN0_9ZZZZ
MEDTPKIKIVTVATHEFGYLKWLKQSCSRCGTELVVLGMERKWKGYVTKIELINEYLLSQDDKDIICFVDAYDVIMLKNVEDLKKDFIEFTNKNNSKIICSLGPQVKYGINVVDDILDRAIKKSFNVGENLTHINPGLYIGYVKELKSMTNDMMKLYIETNEEDDEKLLNTYYSQNQKIISPDTDYTFFNNVPFTQLLDDGDYGHNSYFIHRIGNGILINFLERNGYRITTREKAILLINGLEDLSKKAPYHISRIIDSAIN